MDFVGVVEEVDVDEVRAALCLSLSSLRTSTWGPQTALVQKAGLAMTMTVGIPDRTASAMLT